jgi:hypothetical protein
MALTGHAISQLKQVQQSFAYAISALFRSFIPITSPGQIISQIPQPMHAFWSIWRIMLSFLSEKSLVRPLAESRPLLFFLPGFSHEFLEELEFFGNLLNRRGYPLWLRV